MEISLAIVASSTIHGRSRLFRRRGIEPVGWASSVAAFYPAARCVALTLVLTRRIGSALPFRWK
jgi:hypothetical protein